MANEYEITREQEMDLFHIEYCLRVDEKTRLNYLRHWRQIAKAGMKQTSIEAVQTRVTEAIKEQQGD